MITSIPLTKRSWNISSTTAVCSTYPRTIIL